MTASPAPAPAPAPITNPITRRGAEPRRPVILPLVIAALVASVAACGPAPASGAPGSPSSTAEVGASGSPSSSSSTPSGSSAAAGSLGVPGATPSADAALAGFIAFTADPHRSFRATMRAEPAGIPTPPTEYDLAAAGDDIDLALTSGGSTIHMREVAGRGYAESASGWLENGVVLPTLDLAREPWWYLGSIRELRPAAVATGDTLVFVAPAPYPLAADVLGTTTEASTVTDASLVLQADGRPVSLTVTGTYPDGSSFGTVTVEFRDVGAAVIIAAPSPLAS